MPRRPALVPAVLALPLVALTACGSSGAAPVAGDAGTASTGYPITVTNCGAEVTLDEAPERLVLLKSAAVPFLADLGVLDRAVARAGAYPAEYYDEETLDALEDVPLLTDELDTSGHLQISREVVIAQRPDLLLGSVDSLPRDALDAVDIPLLEEPGFCPNGGTDDLDFDTVTDQLTTYGRVFDRPDEAAAAVAEVQERLQAVAADAEQVAGGRSIAFLYPTVGGGTTYAYGARSMTDAQAEAAGFENVFADVDERVFEVTLEDLLGRDPDVLVLLHSEGDPAEVEQALVDLPGAERLTAVREDATMTQLLNFSEPATPLSLDGLERIVAHVGSAP